MKTHALDANRIAPEPRSLACLFLLSLLLAACSSSTAASQAPEPAPAPAAQVGNHPPVILRVVERQQVVDGRWMFYQDVYFMDPDGDAAAVTYEITSSSLSYALSVPDAPIQASAKQQMAEALFTETTGCWQRMELAYDYRIQDRTGNLSEPLRMAISCTAPPPLDTRPLLMSALVTALPIGGILLLGLWLLFRKRPAQRLPALRSMVLILMLFMFVSFIQVLAHEGGHSLHLLANGVPATLYVHPFFFKGFSRPLIDVSIWKDILGSGVSLPLCLLISAPLWKRRSLALLPLVMVFPYAALSDGINITGILGGDFLNLAQSSGLPPVLLVIAGAVIVCIGLIAMLSLFPLAGLDPDDPTALFALPAALFLWSALSFLTAHLFAPGSPIDLEYFVGGEILRSSNSFLLLLVIGALIAVLYVTLFRKLYPRLPAWLRTETTNLTWKELRMPGILWAASIAIGLVIVI